MEKLSLLSLSLILLSTFSTSPALPQMISYYRDKGLPSPQVELLFSIPSMAIIFILLITPWLSKKLSEKHMIIFGLLLTALGGRIAGCQSELPFSICIASFIGEWYWFY